MSGYYKSTARERFLLTNQCEWLYAHAVFFYCGVHAPAQIHPQYYLGANLRDSFEFFLGLHYIL
jgi:hypothetical protein